MFSLERLEIYVERAKTSLAEIFKYAFCGASAVRDRTSDRCPAAAMGRDRPADDELGAERHDIDERRSAAAYDRQCALELRAHGLGIRDGPRRPHAERPRERCEVDRRIVERRAEVPASTG